MSRFSQCLSFTVAAFALIGASFAAEPATTQSAGNVSPEAAAVVAKLGKAYGDLKSVQMSGKLTGDFDVDGQKRNDSAEFTSSFAAPNQFKNEIKDQSLVGSTGEKLYVYLPKGRNVYLQADAPKKRSASSELPDPFSKLLSPKGSQDIALALAMSNDAAGELTKAFEQIRKAPDTTIDGKSFIALILSSEGPGPVTTLLIDPATSLVRRSTMDVSSDLKAQGAGDVKKAMFTIDYTTTKTDAAPAKDAFAWAPPATAKDAASPSAAGGDDSDASKALTGKPAPDVKLKGLDDKEVALADLKGSVVVLDFWATWCGPCVHSLPELDKLYTEKKEKGVKIFAVNQQEEKGKVAEFMKSNSLSVPVLLDSERKAGEAYKADAIPETVVIGKDGVVKQVFVGSGNEDGIKKAVEEALAASK